MEGLTDAMIEYGSSVAALQDTIQKAHTTSLEANVALQSRYSELSYSLIPEFEGERNSTLGIQIVDGIMVLSNWKHDDETIIEGLGADPLRWFSLAPPQALRDAQNAWTHVARAAVEAANKKMLLERKLEEQKKM